MKYLVIITETSESDIDEYRFSGAVSVRKKIDAMLEELEEHPRTGTEHPKPLGENRSGMWSRRITQKHRLVYIIDEENLIVTVIAARGHYDDR